MTKDYDHSTAYHYSVYRPSLHSEILTEFFGEQGKYGMGLDIGCGTGHSAIALTNFCEKVIGIDPSKDMLEKSIAQPGVAYQLQHREKLEFADDTFDVVTYAGSLYYAKSQQILNETVRVCTRDSCILVYDFELFLEEALRMLQIDTNSNPQSEYDHRTNFSGLDQKQIQIEKELHTSVSVEMSLSDLAHIVLSVKDNYTLLLNSFGNNGLHDKVSQKLYTTFKTEKTTINGMTYLTSYRVEK